MLLNVCEPFKKPNEAELVA